MSNLKDYVEGSYRKQRNLEWLFGGLLSVFDKANSGKEKLALKKEIIATVDEINKCKNRIKELKSNTKDYSGLTNTGRSREMKKIINEVIQKNEMIEILKVKRKQLIEQYSGFRYNRWTLRNILKEEKNIQK